MKYAKNKRCSAFTLIELLVVIAIIAILAAILFPVFAQAKAAAKKASALSNVKEIVLGSIMYANDYDDNTVPYFSYLHRGSGPSCSSYGYCFSAPEQYWPALLSPYIQKANPSGANGDVLAQDLSKIFFDPIENFYAQPTVGSYGNETSWGISDDFINWYGPHNVYNTLLPVNFSAVAGPANNAYFVETWGGFLNSNYPGEAEALSVFDLNNYTWTAASPNTEGCTGAGCVNISSGYSGPPGCANCWNGAWKTTLAPYNSAYNKTYNHQMADGSGVNNVGFADGHVKSVHVGALCTGASALQYWSISGTNAWP